MMKYVLFAVIVCACLGCNSTAARRSADDAGPASGADEPEQSMELSLGRYGRQLLYPPEVDWRDFSQPPEDESGTIIPPAHFQPALLWMSHFDTVITTDDRRAMAGDSDQMTEREAKMALIMYVTEKIYPMKVGLDAVRDGRKYLLGQQLDSRMNRLEVGRHDDGVGVMYREKF